METANKVTEAKIKERRDEEEELLKTVASLIRPLPLSVQPSAAFKRRLSHMIAELIRREGEPHRPRAVA